jgi:hypothetical protein
MPEPREIEIRKKNVIATAARVFILPPTILRQHADETEEEFLYALE